VIRYDELVMGKQIAKGSYGVVYKGNCRGVTVAIKVLHNQHLTANKLEELQNEVDIMKYPSQSHQINLNSYLIFLI